MAEKMLVVVTSMKKLWKWPWQEQKYGVKFLAHGRLPLGITIREGEGYDQAFKRVFGKTPIIRFDSNAKPRRRKARGGS